MGLLDQVIGGVLGNVLGGGHAAPRAPDNDRAGPGGLGGALAGATSSPLVRALLLLLAAKAASGGFGDIFGQGGGPVAQPGSRAPGGGGTVARDNPFRQGGGGAAAGADTPYGDLSGYLDKPGAAPPVADGGGAGGGVGGGGGGLGGALGGGLGGLIEGFQRSGQADVVASWIGHGDNQPVPPHRLGDALGSDTVDRLAQQTGLDRDDLLGQLSRVLPGVVDSLTPQGRVPTPDEQRRW